MMNRKIAGRGILIRMTAAEKNREIKRLRSAYRKGYRWAVSVISNGGYLVQILSVRDYYKAVCVRIELMASREKLFVFTITHLVKMMSGAAWTKLTPKEIVEIREFLLNRFALGVSNAIVGSQAFLTGEFFPIRWSCKIRLSSAIKSLFFAVSEVGGGPFFSFGHSVTLENIITQLSRMTTRLEAMQQQAGSFTICAELDDGLANLMGNGSQVVLYSGRLLNGKVDMSSMIEVADPFATINLRLTVIGRYAGKNGEIKFYNEGLRRMPLGYRGALPGQTFWSQQPISCIIKSGK